MTIKEAIKVLEEKKNYMVLGQFDGWFGTIEGEYSISDASNNYEVVKDHVSEEEIIKMAEELEGRKEEKEMKKNRRSYASIDIITSNNQWLENDFTCILEEVFPREDVEKLLDGEAIVDEDRNEYFIHENEDGELAVSFSFS